LLASCLHQTIVTTIEKIFSECFKTLFDLGQLFGSERLATLGFNHCIGKHLILLAQLGDFHALGVCSWSRRRCFILTNRHKRSRAKAKGRACEQTICGGK
jgi:hypothetical protein